MSSATQLSPTAHDPHKEYLPAERQDAILSLLTQQPVVKVPELARLLNTTPITIRRDLAQLADAGLLRRVRGGAMSVNTADGATAEDAAGEPATATPANAPGGTVGVMFPEPSFFWPHAVSALTERTAECGMQLSITESTYDPVDETRQLDELARVPDLVGLILTPNSHEAIARADWDWIRDAGIPTVVVERRQPVHMDFLTDSVRTDHPHGARKAYWHFAHRGHVRVGAAFSSTPTADVIRGGWERTVAENDALDCPFIETNIQPYEIEKIDRLVTRIVDEQVTGMLVHSDYLAIALAQALQRRGKRVPEDVSLISVDGFATMSSRPLTVLRSSPATLANEAFDLLRWRLQHPNAPTRHMWIDPELIDHGSVVQRP